MGLAAGDLWHGRYRLVRRLGAGGMATVWLARDERLERDVALKLISDVLAGDREYIERFEREARVAAALNHSNLVTIYDFAVADERPYLVMEVVSGGTVAGKELSDRDLERLAEEMLAALEHIHAAGVVHRDIKPANVLIDDHGRFRLTDFGIAQPGDATSLTQTGNLIGTMRYMAPEVRAGQRATERSDLYALGVLLRETGGDSTRSLGPLIDALVQADPANRPGSAREAAALLRLGTIETRVLPLTERTVRMTGADTRRPLPLVAAALVLVAVVALVIAVTGEDHETPTPRDGGQDAPATEQQARPQTQDPPVTNKTDTTPTPAPAEPEPESATFTCAELEEQKKAIEEEKKAAEDAAGDHKEAKEAAKADFEEQKKAIKEQQQSCTP